MKRTRCLNANSLGLTRWLVMVLMGPMMLSAVAAQAAPKITVDASPLNREAKGASYAPIIKRVAPSVVSIYSTTFIKEQSFRHPFLEDPMLRRFFGDQLDSQRQPQPRKTTGLGSGVVVSSDGYLLTNNHVVDGADKVEVALADGVTKLSAKVVGTDPQTDVAVLKIDSKKELPAVTLADSDTLEVGDVVLAIGNPMQVGQSVTMGIVSAVGRGGFGVTDYEDWIQTDAAVNPGNSGGALVDAQGRLVGINTWIVSASGGSAGISFAVPINLAKGVMDRIIADGKVRRGYIGVSVQPLTPQLAKEFRLPDENGALVGGVQPNTPAEDAGLREGDVITEFNGKKVTDSGHFRLMVSQTPPKTKITLKVLREGKEKTYTLILAELPQEVVGIRGTRAPSADPKIDTLEGVELADLDNRSRRRSEIPSSVKGALVTKVESGSAAEEAGLRAGDVILEINRRPVASAEDGIDASRSDKGNRLLLRVWSNGGTRYVVLEPEKRK